MIIAFFVLALIFVAFFIFDKCEQSKRDQTRNKHLELIHRSIEFHGSEIVGPLISELKTVFDQRLR